LPVVRFSGDRSAAEGRAQALRMNVSLWFCHRTHDISPDGAVRRFEHELSGSPGVTRYGFAGYSLVERWVLRALRGPGQPAYSYECLQAPPSPL
jgi:hypothetical protein